MNLEKSKMKTVSVVIPVYNAADCLAELYRRLVAVLEPRVPSFEIVLIEDHGTDNSWNVIVSLARKDSRVRGYQLSRNFGQHPAIAAGLSRAQGDRIIVMDCDLQDQPEEIPKLLEASKEVDIVFARRVSRTDNSYRKLGSRSFFGILRFLSGQSVDPHVGTFSVLTNQVASAYGAAVDRHAHYLQVLRWLGFRHGYVAVMHGQRFAGKSSYSIRKLMRHLMNGIVTQSERLLYISSFLGFAFCLLAVAQIIFLVIRKLFYGIDVEGWASLMAAVWLVGGTLLFCTGVLGIYIAKIFEQGQKRPTFIIRASTDQDADRAGHQSAFDRNERPSADPAIDEVASISTR